MKHLSLQPAGFPKPAYPILFMMLWSLYGPNVHAQDRVTLVADPSYLTGDGAGIQTWEDGVTLSAKDLDGNPGHVVFETRFSDDGFGVGGGRWDQIDFYEEGGNRSEQLILDFGGPVTAVVLTTGMLGEGEGPGSENDDETGLWRAYDAAGNLLAEGLIGPELSTLGANIKYPGTYGKYPIALLTATPLHRVVIEATGFGHGLGRSEQRRYGENNSDFNIMEVSYVRASTTSENQPPLAIDDDFFEIREDIGLTGIQYSTLLANDIDADGDALSVVGFDFAGFPGTIEDFPDDGEILFTTEENFSGLIQFTYIITDGTATSQATISINVINLLDDPVAVQDGPFITNVNQPLVLSTEELLGNDFDPDGEEVSLQSVGEAVSGTVEIQGETVVFVPTTDFAGEASFVYTIVSGTSFPATATSEPIIVEVLAATPSVNGTFVLVPKSNEGVYLQVNDIENRTSATVEGCGEGLFWTISDRGDGYHKIISHFADKALEAWQRVPRNGDDVTIFSSNNRDWQQWEFIDAEDGYFKIKGKYNPRFLTFSGSNANVQNENFLDNQLWRLIDVAGFECNDNPVAGPDDFVAVIGEPLVIPFESLLANDSDPDGDLLTITEVPQSRLGSVEIVDETVVFVPSVPGPAIFTYILSDGRGGLDEGFVSVENVTSRPPIAVDDDFFEIREDIGLTGIQYSTLLANDSDPEGDLIRITGFDFSGFPGSIDDFPQEEEILFTTEQDFSGEITISYTITDGTSTATADIVITVLNLLDPPAVGQDGPFETSMDQPLSIGIASLLSNDTDPDGDDIAFESVSDPVNGTVEVVGMDVVFTPAAGFTGEASFRYSIISGETFPMSATSEPIVIHVTEAPLSINGTFVLVPKNNESVYLQVNGRSNRTSAVVEACDDGLFWTISDRGNGYHKIHSDFADKALEAWSRNPGNGDDATIYSSNDRDWQQWEILDGGDGFVKIKGKFNPRFLTFGGSNATVQDETELENQLWRLVDAATFICNNQPVVESETYQVPAGETVVIPVAELLANDSDPDGDPLTIIEVNNLRSGLGELVSFDGENIVFVPFRFGALLSYVVSDGRGGTDQGVVFFEAFGNRAPVAADDDFFEIREDIGLTGIQYSTLLANDSDPDGDMIEVTGFDFTGFPGTIEDFPDEEEILFTTEQDFSGEITISYTISDGNLTSSADIVITVLNLLDPPTVGQDGPFETLRNQSLTVGIADLLSNDFDPDGDVIDFEGVSDPVHGTVEINGADVVFAPNPDFAGEASFRYTIISGENFPATTTSDPVIVHVIAPNRSPIARNDAGFATSAGSDLVIPFSSLLVNDEDPDGDPLTIVDLADPQNCAVSFANVDEILVEAGAAGFATFAYSISDGRGRFATATVVIDISQTAVRAISSGAVGSSASALVTIYPNPVISEISIVNSNLLPGDRLMLYSSAGKAVKSFVIKEGAIALDVTGLDAGVYFLVGNRLGKIKILKD